MVFPWHFLVSLYLRHCTHSVIIMFTYLPPQDEFLKGKNCIFEQINELIFHVFFSHDLKFMLSLNLSMILGMQGHIIYATN